MTIEATVNDLVASVGALTNSVVTKRAVLDVSANNADASAVAAVNSANAAAASATAAAASATTATNQTAEITAFKNAASALNTSTTATQAVTNLLPDMLAKKDPARHPFRNKLPTLVLDFERQKAHRYSDSTGFAETPLASLMTFTRNSTATYTGPDGVLRTAAVNQPRYDYDPVTGECKGILIEEQRTNLAIDSENLRGANWTAQNARVTPYIGLVPHGGKNAFVLTADTTTTYHRVGPSGVFSGIVANTAYTWSVYAKSVGNTHIMLSVEKSPLTGNRTLNVNLSTGDAALGGSASVFPTASGGCTALGNGWFRCWLTVTPLDNSNLYFMLNASTGSGVVLTGDNAAGIVLQAPQLEVGAFPTSYIPTPATFTGRTTTATYLGVNGVVQTAGVGVARSAAYDYDADGVLRPIGLLLENSATNLLLYSQDYTQTVWAKIAGGVSTAPTITPAYGTAPDGTTTAQRVQLALNSGTTIDDISSLQQGVATVAGSTYTASVWLKTADGSTKTVQLSFNSENPQLLTVTGTWKRFSITGIASDTIRGLRLALRGTTGTSDSADLLMWGAQHELGYYPTSYIPTTTAQVTRAADSSTSAQVTRAADDAALTGTNFSSWYNQEQGTLVTRGAVQLGGTAWPGLASIDDGTSGNRWGLYVSDGDNRVRFSANKRGAAWAGALHTIVQSATVFATAASVKYASATSVTQGGTVVNQTPVGGAPRTSRLKIGVFDYAANSCIRRIAYYPTAFTNEELQVLTSA